MEPERRAPLRLGRVWYQTIAQEMGFQENQVRSTRNASRRLTGKWEGHAMREDRRKVWIQTSQFRRAYVHSRSARGGQLNDMMEAGQLVPLHIPTTLLLL
ncbi:hypothetical protein DdX_11911 [Ditylenchus destructor]|uniref:Uncharacterized protein n=1 Tax=Ditylenchus destructor TaxID=166010 RepID=A0AAD4R4A8_9BILA|nr:hypothetical protein DdX_11911 [Ditylenchus destructor]